MLPSAKAGAVRAEPPQPSARPPTCRLHIDQLMLWLPYRIVVGGLWFMTVRSGNRIRQSDNSERSKRASPATVRWEWLLSEDAHDWADSTGQCVTDGSRAYLACGLVGVALAPGRVRSVRLGMAAPATVLITGAAQRIGRILALTFAADGWRVGCTAAAPRRRRCAGGGDRRQRAAPPPCCRRTWPMPPRWQR